MKELVRDPVCGMELPGNQLFMREFVGGVAYGFCSAACLEEFNRNTAKYTDSETPASATEPFAEGSHEHLTRDPICGMTVDERTALSALSGGKRFYFCSAKCQSAFERF
jgi:Cu+-exporting ATPase